LRENIMRNLSAVIVILFIFIIGLYAQRIQDIESRVKRLKSALEFTDEQAAKIIKIFEAAEKEKQEAAEKGAQDRKARRAAVQERRKKTSDQIQQILTKDQFEKYEKFNRRAGRENQGRELKERLKLNDDQAEKFDEITAASRKQRDEMFEEPGDRREKFIKFRKMRDENNEKIRAFLNENQKKEFEKYLDEQKKEMEERRSRRME
jgi:hypothetical protein